LMIGEIIANNYDELQTKRKTLQELFQPDYVTGEQDVTLRYMATTAAGLQASDVVEIRCRMKSDGLIGHWSKPTQEPITLMFEAYDDLMREGNAAVQLDYNDTLANADYIVKRNADGTWQAMAGMTEFVRAIAQHPITKEIYIGGSGLNIGGDPNADYLAKWNGSAWVSVVAGCNSSVYDLVFDSYGNLYIGGNFTNWGNANGNYIVKWNGSALSSLGTGLQAGECRTLAFDSSGNLYVGGGFTSAGGVANTARIAKWDGTQWLEVGGGIASNTVYTLAFNNDYSKLYIGGNFTNHGDDNGDNITVFDISTASYSSLGTGMSSRVEDLQISNTGDLYAAGLFTTAGGVTANRVAVWNGNKWSPLGEGMASLMTELLYVNNKLYIGGNYGKMGLFAESQEVLVYIGNGIYQPLDINLPGDPNITSLFFDNLDNLYVGFTTTGNAGTAGDDIVTNPGTSTRPKFTITGPGFLRQIVNTTNGKGVYFNNFTLLAGEVVTLDFERQEFASTFRGNILSYILEGISTLDFTLEPGSNRIATFIDGTTDGNTKAVMEYKIRYWSLDEANR